MGTGFTYSTFYIVGDNCTDAGLCGQNEFCEYNVCLCTPGYQPPTCESKCPGKYTNAYHSRVILVPVILEQRLILSTYYLKCEKGRWLRLPSYRLVWPGCRFFMSRMAMGSNIIILAKIILIYYNFSENYYNISYYLIKKILKIEKIC